MARFVGVAKAAKILGVPREDLQQLIRRGDLITFEGRVDVEELEQRFPAWALDKSPMLERARIIRDTAYANRVQDALAPPSRDSLMSQIKRLKVELSVHKGKEESYRQLIDDMLDKFAALQQLDNEAQRRLVQDLNIWLLAQINKL